MQEKIKDTHKMPDIFGMRRMNLIDVQGHGPSQRIDTVSASSFDVETTVGCRGSRAENQKLKDYGISANFQ